MAFAHTETASTSASPEHVWALWSDTSTWPQWDPSVERVVLDGPFRLGTTGTMSLAGGVRAPFTLVAVSPDARYCDELVLGELQVRIDHRVEAAGSGATITVETTVTGPGADDVGPMVVAQAPQALRSLVEMAEARVVEGDQRVSG